METLYILKKFMYDSDIMGEEIKSHQKGLWQNQEKKEVMRQREVMCDISWLSISNLIGDGQPDKLMSDPYVNT